MDDRATLLGLVELLDVESASALKYSNYPSYIKDAMQNSLTAYCARFDITDPAEIEKLSELVDDVAFNIEIGLIDNKKNQILSKTE
ncbi:hypothetical protein VCHA53O466_40276 [Vibrio chagasii]|nr:hypothetical protein VCHA53O466_40276 [Vibrio chagasii]